jgi:fluoroquinolone resistance protein
LENPIISGERYTGQEFKNARLDGHQIISSEFVDCTFNQCSFVETELIKCRFVNCVFRDCDLSLVKIPETMLPSICFEDSKIIGVNWTQADWTSAALGKPLHFSKSTLNHNTFIGLSLKGMQILNCNVVNVDFREADLTGSDFSGSDLTDSLFLHTKLREANLAQARNYSINPGLNDLQAAKFSMPEAIALLYNMDIELTGEDADLESASQ